MGFHVIQPDYNLVLDKINKGYNFIAFSLDTLFLGTICRDQMNLLKKLFWSKACIHSFWRIFLGKKHLRILNA